MDSVPGSDGFLQAALDALPARVAVLDAGGRILAVNAAWRGFAAARAGGGCAVGDDYLRACEEGGEGGACPEGRAGADGVRAVASGELERFAMDYRCGGPGDERCFQLVVTRLPSAGAVRLLVAHEDVSARRQVEEELRRSDERHRAFLEHSSEAIWRFELAEPVATGLPAREQVELFYRHAYLAECNDATARMYGYEHADELIGLPLAELMPHSDVNVEYLVAFVESGYRSTDAESQELDREGRLRHFLNNLVGIVEDGAVRRAWGTQRDVTQRAQDEAEREQARRSMQLALEVARAAVWDWDVAADRVTGDENLARIFRLPFADVVAGRLPAAPFFAMIHPDDQDRVERRMAEILASGGEYELEYRLSRADGTAQWLTARGAVELGAAGRALRVTGLVIDVTAQKQAETDAAFLAELSERIRTGEDADELAAAVGRTLREHLSVSAAAFAELDPADRGWTAYVADSAQDERARVPDPGALASAAEHGEALRAGRTAAVADMPGDSAERLGIGAFLIVPQLRDGRWSGALVVTCASSHDWTPREIALAETVAERTWNAVDKLRLHASLRVSEERYRSLVSASTTMISVAASDGRFVAPQPAWEQYTGQAWEEHRDYGYLEAVHEDDREAAARAWQRARVAGEIFEYEARLRHGPSRAYRWCAARVVPVRGADGSVREWVSSIADVDERRRAETRLRASEAEWRLVFESARDFAIFTLDLRRRVTRWNQGATALLGYDEREIVGRVGDVFFTPEDRAAQVPEREAETAVATGRAENERWHVRKDGSRFWASGLLTTLENERGETVGFVEILRDRTAEKRDAEEREELLRLAERARAEAESANEAKDRFLAMLSHELRSPLQGAIGWVSLLRAGTLPPEEQAKAVAALERNVRHQSELVNDLLDVSRIISGKLRLELATVDLGLVLEQVHDELQIDARRKGVDLHVATGSDPGMVLGDAERVEQIFRNLLTNAIKFTPSGGRVAVECAAEGEAIVVTVADTGRGISSEFLPHIFDRFSQADSSITRQHGGLGLGLGIVRHLVELHEGTIEAESEGPDRGATFRVRLPRLTSYVPSRHALRGMLGPGDAPLRGARVLLVEDDDVTRESVTVVLEHAGASVRAASRARSALDAVAEALPDLILTDLGMPDEDGYWLAQRVRAAGLDIPIAALTGFADAETRARVLAEGFQLHVAKPVDADVLVSELAGLLRGSSRG